MKRIISAIMVPVMLFSFLIFVSAESLPSNYNAADYGYVTSVKNQGDFGTCASFAAISCLESDYIIKGYGTAENTDFSEAYFYWWAINNLWDDESSGYDNDGLYYDNITYVGLNYYDIQAALKTDSAIAFEQDYPYDKKNEASIAGFTDEERFASGCNVRTGNIVNFKDTDLNGIKKWILSHGSVITSFHGDVYETFSNGTVVKNLLAFSNDHAVTIVGWDDDFTASKGLFNVHGAWLCKNSWGPEWGDNGYFWLPYADPTIDSMLGVSVTVSDECISRYSYTAFPYFSDRASAVKTAANAFTVREDGYISCIAAYAYDNTDIAFRIYLDNGGSTPDSGRLVSSFTSHFDVYGFYTVDLPEKVTVSKGSKFFVVATYSDKVPLEDESSGFCADKEAQSYVYYENEWVDLNTNKLYANVPIDALIVSEHSFTGTRTKEPTCTNTGYSLKYCENCGKSERTVIPAKGHSFGEWEAISEPTEAVPGVYKRKCSACGEEEYKQVDYEGNETPIIPEEEPPVIYLSFFDYIILFFVNVFNFFASIPRFIISLF